MTEGVCPSGWHIPSDGEFTELTDFLGGQSVAGDAMKSDSGWNDYDGNMFDECWDCGENLISGNGSNSSGFNGLPGGNRDSGGFYYNGDFGFWWSAAESGSNSWVLFNNDDDVMRYSDDREYGFSARCVRD